MENPILRPVTGAGADCQLVALELALTKFVERLQTGVQDREEAMKMMESMAADVVNLKSFSYKDVHNARNAEHVQIIHELQDIIEKSRY